jgi:hypothetical protein
METMVIAHYLSCTNYYSYKITWKSGIQASNACAAYARWAISRERSIYAAISEHMSNVPGQACDQYKLQRVCHIGGWYFV